MAADAAAVEPDLKQHINCPQFYSQVRDMKCSKCEEKISLQGEDVEMPLGHYLGLADPMYKAYFSLQAVSNGNGSVRSLGVILKKKNAAAVFICKTCFEK